MDKYKDFNPEGKTPGKHILEAERTKEGSLPKEELKQIWDQAKDLFTTIRLPIGLPMRLRSADPRREAAILKKEFTEEEKRLALTEEEYDLLKARYDLRSKMNSSSDEFQPSPKNLQDVPVRGQEEKKPAGREASPKSNYDKKPPVLLYCDPMRLEYYDDGSLRIFDQDIIKALYVWAATHGMDDGLQDGDVIVNARGC